VINDPGVVGAAEKVLKAPRPRNLNMQAPQAIRFDVGCTQQV
jgi:hypothetical protein